MLRSQIFRPLRRVGVLLVVVGGCDSLEPVAPSATSPLHVIEASQVDPSAYLQDVMDAANLALESEGARYRVAIAEWIGVGAGGKVVTRLVGNKRLDYDFVPFDQRRAGWSGSSGGSNDNITFAIDQTGDAVPPLGGLTGNATTAAIRSAMQTWNAQQCSDLELTEKLTAADLGFVAHEFYGTGGSPDIAADIQHAGWQDLDLGFRIAVTFTLAFVDALGTPTDIDRNGRGDVAFTEIYYGPANSWTIGSGPGFDVETIALHEAGHALSQSHFGLFALPKDSPPTVFPRAVMNPVILGVLHSLLGTDIAGHCANWGSWPNT